MKVYGSMFLALRGDGLVQISGKMCYVTLEWPLRKVLLRNDLQIKQKIPRFASNLHTYML